jgi:hypothetical protein
MSYLPISGASRWLVVATALILWSGCTFWQPLQRRLIGDATISTIANLISGLAEFAGRATWQGAGTLIKKLR